MKNKGFKFCNCGRKIPSNVTKCYHCNTKIIKAKYDKNNKPKSYIFEVILPKSHDYLKNIKEVKYIDDKGKKIIILKDINDLFIINYYIQKYCKKRNLIRPQIILDLENGNIILDKFDIEE